MDGGSQLDVTKSAVVLARTLAVALGFATMQPAFAHDARSHQHGETSMHAEAVVPAPYRHHAQRLRLATPGYAATVPAAAAIYAGPDPHFVAGRGIVGESCDLPSSNCSNDMRIAN